MLFPLIAVKLNCSYLQRKNGLRKGGPTILKVSGKSISDLVGIAHRRPVSPFFKEIKLTSNEQKIVDRLLKK